LQKLEGFSRKGCGLPGEQDALELLVEFFRWRRAEHSYVIAGIKLG
jgi:hypothetical protein